jgi:Ca-activated chloride channel homolog
MKKILIAAFFTFLTHLSFAAAGSNSTISVSGTVLDAVTKKPLSDVTVVAVNGNAKSEMVTTNAQGQFKITSLAQGTYTIKLSKDYYKNQEKKDITVKQETTTKVNIELIPEPIDDDSHKSWWDKYDLY